jgi:hypothetical protein
MRPFIIEFGVFKVKYNIPEIELRIIDGINNNYVQSMWLSAFRWYRFQVSGDDNGNGDYGSTPVFGLETFGSIMQQGRSNLDQPHTVKYLIEAAAYDAISEFMFSYRFMEDAYFRMDKPHYNTIVGANPEWDKFIDSVYNYSVHGEVPENTQEV